MSFLTRVIRRGYSANPVKHDLHMVAIRFNNSDLTSINASCLSCQNSTIKHMYFNPNSLFETLITY